MQSPAFSSHHLVVGAAFLAALAESQSARLEAEIPLSSDSLSASNKSLRIMARTLDPSGVSGKRPIIEEQDFMAVVLVGYGEQYVLFP